MTLKYLHLCNKNKLRNKRIKVEFAKIPKYLDVEDAIKILDLSKFG